MRRSKPAPQNEFFPGFTDVTEIGVGSLATVYRAREVDTLRWVALKLLNVRDASPRALESFERESIALGAVSSHPNIVTLYRSFRAADQRPVLVLELCHGSVGERMRGGAGLPVAEVVALGIKIAGALETAHRAEILHRDVKPQNILMTEFGEPALADFGVAMLQSSTQTTAGLFDFTTLHAAPELLEGGDTSAATDVYELASSLYQLIAGRAAFRAYDGESPASVILRILRDSVQPLVNTQAPRSLSDLLLYAMSKDKSSRPPTAAEFAAELAAVEVEQQWPRTQFLIRDNTGGTTGLPMITRLPEVGRRAEVPPPAAAPFAGPPAAAPLVGSPASSGDEWSTPTVIRPVTEEGARPDETSILSAVIEPRPTNERVLVERQVIERLYFEPRSPAPDDGWSEVSIVQAHPDESPARVEHETPPAADVAVEQVLAEPQVWAPPPPAAIEGEVSLPPGQDTRVVQLADAAESPEPEPAMRATVVRAEQAAAERTDVERVEAEWVEAERVAAEWVEAEWVEAERVAAERAEAERRAQVEAERVEAERAEAERRAQVEAERVEAERVEVERVAAEQAEAARAEAERVAAEQADAARAEAERRAEVERVEVERVAVERVEAERAEVERVEAERVEVERVAAEQAEAARAEAERRAESERVEAERAEARRSDPPGADAFDASVTPEPAPADADFASIWGEVGELPSTTAAPPAGRPTFAGPADVEPPLSQPGPPDPATRIAEPPFDASVARRLDPAASNPASSFPAISDPAVSDPAVSDPASDPVISDPVVSDRSAGEQAPTAAVVEPPEPEPPLPVVPWRGALTEPDPFETGEHRVDPAGLAAVGATPPGDQPAQYPIPPSGFPGDVPAEGSSGTVPTWAFRAAAQGRPSSASYGDLALDPTSLRNRVTLRAGTASMTVDDAGLALRAGMRRSTISWGDVLGFEPRFDEGGRAARLVVLTHAGPVELAATRRPAGEVRYIHALLDAYRQRAATAGPR